jgi:hypothetical protein
MDRIEVDDYCRCSKICLVSEWQLKITTDDIDDISSAEENIGHGCESGSMHGLWVPVYSSDAIVYRPATPKQVCRFGHPQQFTLRDVRGDGADHPPVERR